MSQELKERLVASIDHLEYTVTASHAAICKRFGKDSYFCQRLENYNEGIANQKRLVLELGVALDTQNFAEVSRLVILINSISMMIKDDARLLLEEMSTGSTCTIDEDMIN